ncbi:nucleotidyltransferase domain-containing protein [Candidatus Woesearchaeota archaeon]|nr:nucleotidyltransferase domain-containing protein [Candidatus Woesearchaeota archaeon]
MLKLLNNKNARLIFGKRELKIIEKQLLGINLTQSEKNRLSRSIRKKFDFIKEANNFSDYFELKKGFLTKEAINEAKELILKDILKNKIKKIILYGSFAENKFTFNSDIDLSVEFDKINKEEATLFRKRILANSNEKIDIQIYNFLDEKIKKEVIDKGKIIYENK